MSPEYWAGEAERLKLIRNNVVQYRGQMYSRYARIRRDLITRRVLLLMYKAHYLTNITYHYHNRLFTAEQVMRGKVQQLNNLKAYADKVLSKYDRAPMKQLMTVLDQVPEQLRAYPRLRQDNAKEV